LNKNVSLDENKLLQDKNEILEPLRDIRESLNLYKGQHVGNSDLLDLIRRVRCFGINLAKLDIRQESSRHEKLINEVIKKKHKIGYLEISESKKIDLLNSLIKQKKYFLDKINIRDKENKEVWNTFKQISKEPAQCLRCLCNINDIQSFRYFISLFFTKTSSN
jgi:phosphoenolpyruvate carboxylase